MELEIVELKNQAAAITLNRPSKRNALSVSLLKDLIQAVKSLDKFRTLYLLGKGLDFCTGLDLAESKIEQSAELIQEAFQTIENAPQVMIALVTGRALGGGAGLALACDFMLMEEGSSLAFPEVQRGIVPAFVAASLRKKVNESTLKELLLLSKPVGAFEALDLGLALQVLNKEDLLIAADTIAARVIKSGPLAIQETKALLNSLYGTEIAYSLGAKAHAKARHSDEAQEGINAFLEKRNPRWS